MRFSFIFFLVVTIIFGVAYWYTSTASICPTPIQYRLGDIDDRFGIKIDEAKKILSEVELVWENAAKRNLFDYNDKTDFTVNFIYDERQKEASTEEAWRLNLDEKEKKVELALVEIEKLQVEYEDKRKKYENTREHYELSLISYNNEVEKINTEGGATKDQYFTLEKKKNILNIELKSLQALEEPLKEIGLKLNSTGEKTNLLVENYNTEVSRYNDLYGERNESFTQGDYERERINVYTFNTKEELTKVLAHEFGHSLGIGHIEKKESLMYYLMADQPTQVYLSDEDIEAFTSICGDGTDVGSTLRRIIRTALLYF